MLMCAGEAPTGLLGGSLFEREIYQKLSLKINQKLIRVRRSAHLLFRSALRAEINKKFNSKIIQKFYLGVGGALSKSGPFPT